MNEKKTIKNGNFFFELGMKIMVLYEEGGIYQNEIRMVNGDDDDDEKDEPWARVEFEKKEEEE